MKKLISVALVCAMLLVCLAPAAFAAKLSRISVPVVFVGGQEEYIYADKTDPDSAQFFTGSLPESVLEEITDGLNAALIKGLSGNWTDYVNGFVDGAMVYYSDIMLDGAGEPVNMTGYDCLKEPEIINKGVNGRYGLYDYKFIYDWRLDPMANAADLNAFIDEVIDATGFDQVDIVAQGIGVGTVLAYMKLYGTDKISELVLDNAALNGSEAYGAMFADNVQQDPEKLAVFVAEARRNVALLQAIKREVSAESWEDFLSVKATRAVYGKVYEEVIPQILRNVYATMPGYWTLIPADMFDAAIDGVFPDFESAAAAAVLIAKLEDYHNNVAVNVAEILNGALENGVHVYNIVNYGFQMVPVSKDAGLSDVYTSVESATLGATVAPYGETFSEDYLAEAKANGTEKYISPEKNVDASTGFIPDHTWFVKNLEQGHKPEVVDALIAAILNFNGYTNVDDIEEYPQYLYCSNDFQTLSPLNAAGSSDDQPEEPQGGTATLTISNFFDFVRRFIDTIIDLVRSLVDFGQSNPFSTAFSEENLLETPSEPAP